MSVLQTALTAAIFVVMGWLIAWLWGSQAKLWFLAALAILWLGLWLLTRHLQRQVPRTAWKPRRRKRRR